MFLIPNSAGPEKGMGTLLIFLSQGANGVEFFGA